MSGSTTAEAAQLWRWCREEGGAYERYSKGEVRDMLASGAALPQDLVDLTNKRRVIQNVLVMNIEQPAHGLS